MSKRAILVLLASIAATPVWAINKCTAKDGTVSFQETPCPNETQAKEVQIPSSALGSQPTSKRPGNRRFDELPPPQAGTQDPPIPAAERPSRLARTVTDLEAMASTALSCKQKLSSNPSDAGTVCNRWASLTTSRLEPSMAALRELSKDAGFRDANRGQFDRAYRAIASTETDALVIKEKLHIF